MKKSYLIPHNYTDNGRIFSMIEKDAAVKALLWLIPAFLITFFIPLSITLKFTFFIIFGTGPVMVFITGLDLVMLDIISFNKNAKIYYDVRGDDVYEYFYELTKKEETQNPKASKKPKRAHTN